MKINIQHIENGKVVKLEPLVQSQKTTLGEIYDIEINKYDLWEGYHTLANIILPILQAMKNSQMGSPNVDSEDVPEELRYKGPEELRWEDEGVHDRWNWVMDEMIWAFEQHASEDDDSHFLS